MCGLADCLVFDGREAPKSAAPRIGTACVLLIRPGAPSRTWRSHTAPRAASPPGAAGAPARPSHAGLGTLARGSLRWRSATRALQHGPAQPGGLHQQERPEQRRAQQRADGGDGAGPGRSVPPDQADGQAAEATAEAIRGASGPSTTPRLRVANAASTMPGSSAGAGGPPPTLNPSAGEWPPLPGRYRMVRATSTPASSSGGIGPPPAAC
jgi:hypothetical protein